MSLEILNSPPTFDTAGLLRIEALAPLSMVVQMPGKYYRSQSEPSREMLYGLLENALGWHVQGKERSALLKTLVKRHKLPQPIATSGVGFESLLQFHVRIGIHLKVGTVERFDDYWSQHLRTAGLEFVGGSREHDSRLIPLINAYINKNIGLTDSGGIRDEDIIEAFQTGDQINFAVVRPYFPRYYVTPTPREYVIPNFAYMYRVETSPEIADLFASMLEDPIAPLYLGSNDGWVEASWQMIPENLQ